MARPKILTPSEQKALEKKQELAKKKGLLNDDGVRTKLKRIDDVRDSFYGKFERFGRATDGQLTLLITDIHNKHGNIIADHVWFKRTKGFKDLGFIEPGEYIRFDARIKAYEKGYKGQDDRILKTKGNDIKTDYKFSHPSQVKRFLGKPGQRLSTIDKWDKRKRLDILGKRLDELQKKTDFIYSWKERNNV